jgi:membrane protease YdiL (CAAX protease family)
MEHWTPPPPPPPRRGVFARWSRLRILALAALLLVGNFLVQLVVYGLTGDLSWPVLAGAVVGVGLPVLLLARGGELDLRRDLSWRWPSPATAMLVAILALASIPPTSLLAEFSLRLHPADPAWVRMLNEQLPRGPLALALAGLALVVAAPLAEELVFRALLHRLVSGVWGALPGALISSLVFAIAHAEPWFLLGLVGIGLMLAVVWEGTRSLPAVWLAHALHNAFSLGMMTTMGGVSAETGDLSAWDLVLAGGGLALAVLVGRELLRRR